jgi:EmrB/QacA subfamily drug resistance transporter
MADPNASTRRSDTLGLDREILTLAAVVILGTSMTVLDLTIVNVAVPTLGSDLHTSISTIQWVLTGYMLAFASVIPLAGWASERFGTKRVWLFSLLLFMLGSGLAGLAWSTASLIAFRIVQGLGAGMILPVGQTILAQAAGPQRMGRVMSVFGVPMLLVPVLGPVLGGAIVDQWSWRWIFFINLPVGVAAVVTAQRLLPEAKPQLGQRLDLRGLALLSPGIAVFLYGLAEAGHQGGFDNTRTIAALTLGLALVALFVWHASRRGKEALIDLSLFRRRGFAAAAATNFLLPVALFGSLILLPLYYQLVRHESPLQVGLLLAPQAVGAALAMPLAGLLTDKIGARVVVSSGMLIALLGTLAFTQVGADTSYLYLAAARSYSASESAARSCPRWRPPSRRSRARRRRGRRARSTPSSGSPAPSAPRCSRSSSSVRSPPTSPASTVGSKQWQPSRAGRTRPRSSPTPSPRASGSRPA